MEAGVFSMFTMTTLAKRRMATPTTASTADVFLFIVVRPPQQSSHNLEPSNTSSDMESRSTFYGIATSRGGRSLGFLVFRDLKVRENLGARIP